MNYEVIPVSILIPAFKRPTSLKRTLNSYICYDVLPDEIIIVDQSPNEDIYKVVKEFQCSKLPVNFRYYHLDQPSSTAARNIALYKANNDICIFSDDDVDIFDNTLSNLFSIMNDTDIAMVAGLDINMISTISNTRKNKLHVMRYLSLLSSYRKRNIGHVTPSLLGVYPDNIHGYIETEWAMGYFFAIRKHLAIDITWDENLTGYAYAEDLDFSHRYYLNAKANNKRCIICDDVKVDHIGSKEYRIPSETSIKKFVCNREYLSYKWNLSWVSRVACHWTNFILLMQRIIRNDHPEHMITANKVCRKNKKMIQSGYLNF